MESNKVTLVMGVYNPKVWFHKAIESANDLFEDIIIVDDGSDIIDVGKRYWATVRHETNKGFYEARNTGCNLVKTEWIASLDDDDEFIRENVEELKEFLKATDADIVHFPCLMFGDVNGLWGDRANMDNILLANQIPSGSWFKKSVWEKVKFKLPEAEDWDFWARAKKHGFKFAYFPKPIYKHRMRPDSLSAGWFGDKFLQIREDIRKSYDKEII